MGNSQAVQIAMLGLDGAGKTTVLYRLKINEYAHTVPTVGFNCEKVRGTLGKSRGVTFTIWDVGGQEQLRPLWKTYTRSADGIIFVVDSHDTERLEEAKVELQRVSKTPESAGTPILVYANKQDLPGALHRMEIERVMNISEMSSSPNQLTDIQESCAVTGEGLFEGIDILHEMITKRRKMGRRSNARRF